MSSSARTTSVTYSSIDIDGPKIAYREAGTLGKPKVVLLHGFPSGSHQYLDLIRALSDRFHVIGPDYQRFGNSDAPDPGAYAYSFDNLAAMMEKFLSAKDFDRYGLYVQDYGGPVGFRIVGRRPEALEWLVVQNSNAYEVGFMAVWDGLRGALWKNRSPETEKPLEAFLTRDTVKAIYMQGAKKPEFISPRQLELRLLLHAATALRAHESRPILRLSDQCGFVPEVAGLYARASAEVPHFLGPGRHLFHGGRRRSVPYRFAECSDTPPRSGPFRSGGPPRLHLRPYAFVLRHNGGEEIVM